MEMSFATYIGVCVSCFIAGAASGALLHDNMVKKQFRERKKANNFPEQSGIPLVKDPEMQKDISLRQEELKARYKQMQRGGGHQLV